MERSPRPVCSLRTYLFVANFVLWLPIMRLLSHTLFRFIIGLGPGATHLVALFRHLTGTAAPSDPYWLESLKHQGTAAFNANPASYQVFRNVKDFGAVGDGVTDDTAAINSAISSGSRCGGANGVVTACNSTTITPALVYFPSGTYLVSTPIIAYYYTQLIGDAKTLPTIRASASFTGLAVIDADPYIDGGNGAGWYYNTNSFFRSVRNFRIDLTQMPAASSATGIHWQVSQATSLMNIVVDMSTAAGNSHQGIWMENGSGGYMGDLVFNGGKFGMWVGNQQFTVRNITVNNADTAVYGIWNWGWTFQRVTISNCQVGFDLTTGGLTEATQTAGGEAIIDAVVSNTPIFLRSSKASSSLAGSLVLNNIQLTNVDTAVGVLGGAVVLAGGTKTIDSWGQGNVYSGSSSAGTFTQGDIVSANKPSVLLDGSGHIFGKMHPQYESYAASQFVSVKDNGAVGDGVTDDTAALNNIFAKFSGCNIIFFDAGTYVVTSTLTIPAGTQMVGEAWSVIAGTGSAFQDSSNPTPIVKVGESGSKGVVEISDILFMTIGPTPGAIVVEWNVAQPDDVQGGAGMWDSHIRLGGSAGTNLEATTCPAGGSAFDDCSVAFLALHLTAGSTAYLEGTWVWTADHDLDGDGYSRISLYSGRGILSESSGPVWLIGTGSEHHTLYQYNLVNAANHYMGLIQTETPYYQPSPLAPAPFTVNAAFKDPSFDGEINTALGLRILTSTDIIIFGGGLYSFFSDYSQDCLDTRDCQAHIASIDSASSVTIYSLNTVATTNQLTLDGVGIINQSSNINGFASMVTAWSPA
ncbi:glycoside hydrolase family 55 protein [Hymenopellis radicata]|nr:glycoside hydrolase family 55 protein [Hymenopellis radicata]